MPKVISQEVVAVQRALADKKYMFRTVEGIADDTCLTPERVLLKDDLK